MGVAKLKVQKEIYVCRSVQNHTSFFSAARNQMNQTFAIPTSRVYEVNSPHGRSVIQLLFRNEGSNRVFPDISSMGIAMLMQSSGETNSVICS